jgi:hypothetical protein
VKNVLNGILLISIIFVSLFSFLPRINSVEYNEDDKTLRIYSIKGKDEVLVENNNIIDFYEDSHEQLEKLIEEKRLEEERIAKEQRIRFKTNVVNYAMKFVGGPYVLGGNSLTNGTDCSGFVKLVYANYGVSLPRTAPDQSLIGDEVSIDDIEVGDIISYGYNGFAGHSALYIGDGKIVHASTSELGIRIDSMYIMPIISIRRVI